MDHHRFPNWWVPCTKGQWYITFTVSLLLTRLIFWSHYRLAGERKFLNGIVRCVVTIQILPLRKMYLSQCINNLPLQCRHNKRDGVSNPRRLNCLFNRLFGRRSKKTSKLRVFGLCERNSPVGGDFPAKRVSNAENVSMWWRHHARDHLWCISVRCHV